MESTEFITEMFTRFTEIINGLKSLEKSYTNSDLVRKILRSLPRVWEAKVTAIQEAKDLNTLQLKELLGSLMTYELTMKQNSEEEVKKRKTIALKSTAPKQETASEESDEEEEYDEEGMAMFAKKFRKFMKGKKKFHKRKSFVRGSSSRKKGKEKEKEKEVPICYECNKPGHFKIDCPELKWMARKLKKRNLMVEWSESEESSSEEKDQQETAQICYMANDDEVDSELEYDFSVEELHDAFLELIEEHKKLIHKIKF